MATPIKIPEVGESVTSGVIAAWLKADGDYVERDEAVLELETDKVTMEVPAPAAGVLSHSASEGDEVEVGATVGSIAEGEAPAQKDSGKETAKEPAGQKEDKKEEKQAEAGSADSGKSSAAVAEAEPKATPQPAAPSGPDAGGPNGALHATPLARKIAREQGVDLSRVKATGAAGRIREQDVLAYLSSGAGSGGAAGDGSALPAAAGQRSSRREKMSPLRQRVATRLVEAQQTAAMLTTFNECDMTAIMALRKRFKEPFQEKHGVGLGFMSFFIKAACHALGEVPKVNAAIVDDGGKGGAAIEYHDYCDIAIAVASPKGLVVPVLRNAERMSFAGIEAAVKDFGSRAKEGKLTLDEITGGTFTITNGGVFGSLNSTPILNPPQAGILGMHAIKNRAVEDPSNPGQIALRPMMYLALSYDHRLIDGAEAVTFLVKIKEAIEDPQRLLLEV